MSCRVAVEAPHRHHHVGNLYHVRVALTLTGGEVVAGRDPALHRAHEDVFVAVRDAFRAARRELMDFVRVRRRQVKSTLAFAAGVFANWHYRPTRSIDPWIGFATPLRGTAVRVMGPGTSDPT